MLNISIAKSAFLTSYFEISPRGEVKVLPKCNFCMLLLWMLLKRSTFEQQLRYFHIANKSRVQHKEIVKHDQLWQLLQHSGHCSPADMHTVTLLTSPACNIAWVWLIDRDFRCQKRTLVVAMMQENVRSVIFHVRGKT